MASIHTLKSLAGTTMLDVDDSGNLTATGVVTGASLVGNVTGNASGTAGALASGAAFTSTEVTGTGSAQNTAHGLGSAPRMVWATVTESAGDAFDVLAGTHTSTNAIFTVTSGVKYVVHAIK